MLDKRVIIFCNIDTPTLAVRVCFNVQYGLVFRVSA